MGHVTFSVLGPMYVSRKGPVKLRTVLVRSFVPYCGQGSIDYSGHQRRGLIAVQGACPWRAGQIGKCVLMCDM